MSIYESLKKVWEPTLKVAYKTDYKGIVSLDTDSRKATFYPITDDKVDWDSPKLFASVARKAFSSIVRASAGTSNSAAVVRLDTEGDTLLDVGIPLWDTYGFITLDKLEDSIDDLSLDAVLIWAAAGLVDKAFDKAVEEPPCPMAGYAPRLQPFRKALRDTMDDAEANLAAGQIGKDHAWRLAVMANALLSVCQPLNQWSVNVTLGQTQEAICKLRVLRVKRLLHLSKLEGDEVRSSQLREDLAIDEALLVKVTRQARNAEFATALALS